ncbi:MAG: uridine kinase [Candidatus Latescibacteria bacterium 4484_107]|nr:MAG: uridine kinase [Candidatus Latescibacteria bacterium 4484_107]
MLMNLLIGIAGGTGSGKSTIAKRIVETMGEARAVLIEQDAYYRDRSHLAPKERERVNYDHPSAFDAPLLIAHLRELKSGRTIPRLSYEYGMHIRVETGAVIPPRSVIVLEGIMALHDPDLRALMDRKVFVDAAPDVRFIRRLKRDLIERGDTVESVIERYLTFVRPMHSAFVEPSRQYADLVVSGEEPLQSSVDQILSNIAGRR